MAFPILVDKVSNYSNGVHSGQYGPFVVNPTTRYLVLWGNNITQGTVTLGVFKSTDNGQTWNVQNEAGAPVASAGTLGFIPNSASFDGTVIRVFFVDGNTLALKACDFTPGADTWGAVKNSGLTMVSVANTYEITSAYRSTDGKHCYVVTNGSVVAPSGDHVALCQFGTFDGTTWAAQVGLGNVDLGPSPGGVQLVTPQQMIESAAGVMQCLLNQSQASGPALNPLLLQGVSSAGATGMLRQLDTTAPGTDTNLISGIAYNPISGKVDIAYTNFNNAGVSDVVNIKVLEGASALNVVPVQIAEFATPGGVGVLGEQIGMSVAVGILGIFWGEDDGTGNANFLDTFNEGLTTNFIGNTVNGPNNLDAVMFSATAFGLFWVSWYWEAAAPPPAPPAPPGPSLIIFPFPIEIDCCCPELVSCLKKSKDGNMYAFTKTPLTRSQ